MEKGESDLLNELEETVPKGLVPLLKIPGLGGRKLPNYMKRLELIRLNRCTRLVLKVR